MQIKFGTLYCTGISTPYVPIKYSESENRIQFKEGLNLLDSISRVPYGTLKIAIKIKRAGFDFLRWPRFQSISEKHPFSFDF